MRFLFRLDLSFHTNAEKKIEILNFATKQGASFPICPRRWRMGESRWRTVRRAEKKRKWCGQVVYKTEGRARDVDSQAERIIGARRIMVAWEFVYVVCN